MIRKSMFSANGAAPMRNSMNFQFGEPEPDPLGNFRNRFTVGGDTSEDVIPNLAADMAVKEKANPTRKFKATEALMDYIASQPQRDSYKLGKWGKVGSALASAATGYASGPEAGIRMGQELKDRPYQQALQDYGVKGHGVKLAADIESDMYGQDLEYRKLMQDWVDKNTDNLREAEKLGLSREEFAARQLQWKQEHELNRAKLLQDGWREVIDPKGNLKLINDQTKEERNLGPTDEQTRLRIAGQVADARTASAGAAVTSAGAAVQNANTNAQNAMTNAGRAAVDERNVNSQIKDREAIDPTEEIRLQAAAAKEVIADNPAYAKYVNEDGTINMDMLRNNRMFWDDNTEKDNFVKLIREKLNQLRTRKKGDIVSEPLSNTIKLPPIPRPGGN